MFGKLVEAGLGLVIKAPLLKLVGCRSTSPAMQALQHYWSGRPQILGQAFQDAFEHALLAVAWGVAPEGFWQGAKGMFKANVTKVFTTEVVEPALLEYFSGQSKEEMLRLRGLISEACLAAANQKESLFPLGEFSEPMLASLLNDQVDSQALSALLFERLGKVNEFESTPVILGLFAHNDLLLRAVFQFFRELLLRDDDLQKVLEQIQQAHANADIQLLKKSHQDLHLVFEEQLLSINGRFDELMSAQQEAMANHQFELLAELGPQLAAANSERLYLTQHVENLDVLHREARKEWQAFGANCEANQEAFRLWSVDCSSRLDDIYAGVGHIRTFIASELEQFMVLVEGAVGGMEDKLDEILSLLQRNQVDTELSAKSFFSVTNINDVQKIKEAEELLRNIPLEEKKYSRFAIPLGSAYAAIGDMKKAEHCFQNAAKSARIHKLKSGKVEALAYYNLFQIYIQQGAHHQALESLNEAVKLDKKTYLPFPMDSYQPLRILGAGGMGCAFLCEGTFNKEKVVVKIFWSTEEGSHKEVFQEAYMMSYADKNGEFIPKVLNAGFVNELQRERPYLVMEYIEGSIDGESYLRQHGRMSWSDGLAVGLKVARALQKAHERQICHLDLKPANLLLCETEDGFDVRIIDFGLSRVARSLREDIVQRSRSGMTIMAQQIFGTLDYAPPEQLGSVEYGEPGPRSDLFSFAATLYRLLTDEPPKTINPRKLPHTPHGFYALLCWCMMANPTERPDSAEAVVEKLEKLKTPGRHPMLEKSLNQALADQILEDSEEAMLWNIVQLTGFDQEYMLQMVEESLNASNSRRLSAIWCEEWMQLQPPERYPVEQVWEAMSEAHGSVYTAKGGKLTPWLQPIDHLRSDPAFGSDGNLVWLRVWEALPEFQNVSSSNDEPDHTLQDLSVGRFVRLMALDHFVWLQVLHPDTGKPVADETELQLVRRHASREGTALEFNGRHKVKRVVAMFEEVYGLRVSVLDADGEPADVASRVAAHRLVQGRWAMCMGEHLFLFLQPPGKKGVCAWKEFGTIRFGGVASSLIGHKETIPVSIRSKGGEFAVTLVGEKNRFRNMKPFFDTFPALKPGDVVCLTSIEEDVFDADIFWRSGEAELSDKAEFVQDVAEIGEKLAPAPSAAGDATPEEVNVDEVAGDAQKDATHEQDASPLEAIHAMGVTEIEEDEENEDPNDIEEEVGAEGSDVGDADEQPAVVAPVALDKVTIDTFVKEFAMEYRVWLQILHPETLEPLPPDAFIDDHRTHPPTADELALHGAAHTKTAIAKIEKHLGLKVNILGVDGEPALSDKRLARYWLQGGAHLLRMGKSVFFTLKPPTPKGILSWRKNGYLKFGKQGETLFPGQENMSISVRTEDSTYEAALQCKWNQFGRLHQLFRDNPDLEPGDIICFTRTSHNTFDVEFFIGSSDVDIQVDDEDEDEMEISEAKELSHASLSAVPEETMSEAEREQRFRELIKVSNAALASGDIEAAWSGYNELHFQYPILLESDLDAYRRVAAARFFQEGLEMVEDDPGFALRKFEGANALDKTLLPMQVKKHIEELKERRKILLHKRFIRLCKKACQIAPTDPEEALELFAQAKERTPQYWSEQLEQWVLYARQLIARRERAQG